MHSKPINHNKISAPSIDLPKGGGAQKGIGETFQPNAFTGTGSYSISFPVSPARGFEPNLALQYNSGAGNSEFGLGFSLSVSKISIRTEKGIPRYDGHDIFILDTNVLVPKQDKSAKNQNGWDIIEYLQQVESNFSQIRQYIKTDKSQSYWEIISNENVISTFGKNNQSRIYNPKNPSQIFEWLIETSIDAKGNKINYSYISENNINVPNSIYEQNRIYNNKYIHNIKYGNFVNKNGGEDFAFEIIFNYGEYNFSSLNTEGQDPYSCSSLWQYRPDSFSSYKSGFEIRTCRLCYDIALFHHIGQKPGAPFLVKTLNLAYNQKHKYKNTEISTLSILEKVKLTGYKRNGDKATDTYQIKQMPPILLRYSKFNPPIDAKFNKLTINSEPIPGYLNTEGFLPIDLNCEGITGLLYNNNETIFYCEPKGNGEYSSPKPPTLFPSDHNFNNGTSSLVDLKGNGELDLMVKDTERFGFYRQTNNGEWDNYQSFKLYPNNYLNPSLEEVRLNNTGKTDLLLTEKNDILLYPSLGEKGFDSPLKKTKQHSFPSQKKGSNHEYIGFANLFGDGLQHRIRIKNRSIECWPNLGYGSFGKKIMLANAPFFGKDFDPSRLFFADIDGSGITDLAYVYSNRIELFINNGNSFSDAIILLLPEIYCKTDQITFADIQGNGTTCLIFSKMSTEPRHYYYNFIGEITIDGQLQKSMKPYLLKEIDNNMGAIREMLYCSSVKFYLEDKKAGRPWITKLPFPVQVIEKIIIKDLINGSRYTTNYKYHDGYYDQIEKEFRGFGYIETYDSESYEEFQKNRQNKKFTLHKINKQNFISPIYTRTWYHTGASFTKSGVSNHYKNQYFKKDKNSYDFPDSIFDKQIYNGDTETLRQAYMAMCGHVIRTEKYSRDNTKLTNNPYRVDESNVEIKLYQPRYNNMYAVFIVNPRESITYHYERNINDPRVEQHFTLNVDNFGNILQSCKIYLPRRTDDITKTKAFPEQKKIKGLLEWQTYISPLSGFLYCHNSCEQQSFEINGLNLNGHIYFSYNKIKEQLQTIGFPERNNILSYDTPFTSGVQGRQLTWERCYYWNEEQDNVLPLKGISLKALIHHNEHTVFTKNFTIDVFNNKLINTLEYDNNNYLKNIIYSEGGYFYDPGSTYWWNKGLVQHYYLSANPERFYLPCSVENTYAIKTRSTEYKQDPSLCKKTTIDYDNYYLSPISITEKIDEQTKNTISAVIDCVTRQPRQITDINNNITQVIFDPLGQVIVTSLFGIKNGIKHGGMTLYPEGDKAAEYTLQDIISFEDILKNTKKYLQGAHSFFYYDLTAWKKYNQPSRSINLTALNHFYTPQKKIDPYCQILINYSDGLGRELESKQYTGSQWQVSNKTVYNNKGKPFKQYLPYFSNTPNFENFQNIKNSPPTLIYYDPLLRPIRIDTPKGFFTKRIFSPWEETYFDENDTVKDSKYYKTFFDNYPATPTQIQIDEKDALNKASKFYNTPITKVIDNTGSTFLEIHITERGKKLFSFTETDITGRIITSIDPRLYSSNCSKNTNYYNFRYRYTMDDKKPALINSVDAGIERHLNNIFGNQLWSLSPRNYCQIIRYDMLERKLNVKIKKIEDSISIISYNDFNLVEIYVYGETKADSYNKNLRGQVYQTNDLSGIITNSQYSLQGQVEQISRQMTTEYKAALNWNNPIPLEDEIHKTFFTYNALKQITTQTTPDGSVTIKNYNQLGLLNTIAVTLNNGTTQPIINNITYNAQQQRIKINYGNNVTTNYTYEETTSRLINLFSKKPGTNTKNPDTTVQDIWYTYQPVGNITRTRDNSFKTIFNNNQQVTPLSDYTYDALYRLTKATGRQHPGINGDTYKNNKNNGSFKQCIFSQLPSINDSNKLETYTETYTYDDSGNLIKKQHTAASSSYTTESPVKDNSNRLEGIDYDASGNQRQLEINNSVTLSYNCCNNLIKTGIILRPEEADDCEYYLYDNSEIRSRKINERLVANGNKEIIEKTYLGNYEIKRNRTINSQGNIETILERQSLRIMDDTGCIAILYYWKNDDRNREVDTSEERRINFQLGNNLGSISLETDANGLLISYEEYFPFGGSSIIAGKNQKEVALKDYRYSGKECDDSTGMYYYGARYYISWLGRWNKPDPGGTIDGYNLYAFIGNNPVTHTDDNGMMISQKEANKTQRKYIYSRSLFQAEWTSTPQTLIDFKIVSWNTQDKEGRALDEFTKTRVPDVLLVQEAGAAPGTGTVNKYGITVGSVKVMRNQWGTDDKKQQQVYFAHVPTGSKNLMTLSLYPIANAHTLDLTNETDKSAWRYRPALAVEIGGNPIINFHLVSGYKTEACRQLGRLIEASWSDDRQVFLAGDANISSSMVIDTFDESDYPGTIFTQDKPTQKSGGTLDHGLLLNPDSTTMDIVGPMVSHMKGSDHSQIRYKSIFE